MIVANDNPADELEDALDRRIAELERAGRIASVPTLYDGVCNLPHLCSQKKPLPAGIW